MIHILTQIYCVKENVITTLDLVFLPNQPTDSPMIDACFQTSDVEVAAVFFLFELNVKASVHDNMVETHIFVSSWGPGKVLHDSRKSHRCNKSSAARYRGDWIEITACNFAVSVNSMIG